MNWAQVSTFLESYVFRQYKKNIFSALCKVFGKNNLGFQLSTNMSSSDWCVYLYWTKRLCLVMRHIFVYASAKDFNRSLRIFCSLLLVQRKLRLRIFFNFQKSENFLFQCHWKRFLKSVSIFTLKLAKITVLWVFHKKLYFPAASSDWIWDLVNKPPDWFSGSHPGRWRPGHLYGGQFCGPPLLYRWCLYRFVNRLLF